MTDIRLENITKIYRSRSGNVTAVDDVSLTIANGEFFFLLGPSGCGKTTLLRMIAGLVEPTRGHVLFDKNDVTDWPTERRNTAMVFQNYALWPHMTVQENVEFGPQMHKSPHSVCRKRAEENLSRVAMSGFENRKPGELSGGQQQRVALARALATEPACLLLDEPLSNLDARLRLIMRGQLRQLVTEAGATGIYVTHDQKEALSMADRIAVMDQGCIVQIGTPTELYNRPANRFVADFLGEANLIDGRVIQTGPITKVHTDIGILTIEGSSAPMDSAVTACLRPERLNLQTKNNSITKRPNTFPATVENSTYLGDLCQYNCRMSNGMFWHITTLAGAAAPLPAGMHVQLIAAPNDIAVFFVLNDHERS